MEEILVGLAAHPSKARKLAGCYAEGILKRRRIGVIGDGNDYISCYMYNEYTQQCAKVY